MMVATLYQAFDESSESPVSDLVFACVGPLAFICFASQVRQGLAFPILGLRMRVGMRMRMNVKLIWV